MHGHHHIHRPYGLFTAGAGVGASSGLKSGVIPNVELLAEQRAAHAFVKALDTPPKAVAGEAPLPTLRPLDFDGRSGNELRPRSFAEMVGQERLKSLFGRVVQSAGQRNAPIDHILLVGSAGTGKTTFGQVIAQESGRRCFALKAPIAQDVLEALARAGKRGDIVLVDEFHMAAKGDRRGANPVAAPEQLLLILEDHRLQVATSMIRFPEMTWIACTTDVGLLPEPLISRFPLQPHLDEYTGVEMALLAAHNAESLGLSITPDAAAVFAHASGNVPRQTNRYIRNAQSLCSGSITEELAKEIVVELNGFTLDGLSPDQQNMLRFLLGQRREDARGNVRYQASINSIATATGHSRDSKAVSLFVEPALIKRGFVAVTHGGRALTDAGEQRARELC